MNDEVQRYCFWSRDYSKSSFLTSSCRVHRHRRTPCRPLHVCITPRSSWHSRLTTSATPPMQPNNTAADLKPQGEASAKVKVHQTCAFARTFQHICSDIRPPALLRLQGREICSRRMHALLDRQRSTGSLQGPCRQIPELYGKLWLQDRVSKR